MDNKIQETQKKVWSAPSLEVFGDMQALTQLINKSANLNDGVAFQGVTIGVT